MTITSSLRIALVALPALVLVQCGGDQKAAEAPSTMPSAEPPSDQSADPDAGADVPTATPEANAPPAAKPETLNDAQIAAVTEAANTGEIAQAKIAQVKAKDAGVKTFAAMMITHHGQAKQKQAKLKLKPEESGISTSVHADGEVTLKALNSATAKDFDKTYIDAQVTGHQKVLDIINDKLLPSVKDAGLKAYLEEIKPTVEEHLRQAKKLQQSFDTKSSSAPSKSDQAG